MCLLHKAQHLNWSGYQIQFEQSNIFISDKVEFKAKNELRGMFHHGLKRHIQEDKIISMNSSALSQVL